jgi:exopolyphosphatase/guanosine-5'-triphosphate,3'-diphosphate pyrophosphatase
MERTLAAIDRLAARAQAQGARAISGFGTSAMRDGYQNAGELIARAAAMGVALTVLSGEEEARLAYAGAAPAGSAGVIDIGGGSTEFMTGEGGRVLAAASAQMGAVRLKALSGGETAPEKCWRPRARPSNPPPGRR